jgi:hypothetical protein
MVLNRSAPLLPAADAIKPIWTHLGPLISTCMFFSCITQLVTYILSSPSAPSGITPPAPLRDSIAPSPPRGITPPAAFTSRGRPPSRMEFAATTIVGFNGISPQSPQASGIFLL